MKLSILSAGFALLFTVPALAISPRVGNGGGTWVCSDRATEKVRWIEMVDLFEAKNEFGFNLLDTGHATPWEILQQKVDLIAQVSPRLNAIIQKHPVDLHQVIRFLPESTGLTVIEDAAIRVRPLPSSCVDGYLYYGQLANFTFDGRLLISTSLWVDPAFDHRERGALLVHETIYKAMREGLGDKNSSRVRQIVGILFADMANTEKTSRIDAILQESAPQMAVTL